MAETSSFTGSTDGVPLHLNGSTAPNGALSPRVNAKGVIPYLTGPTGNNGVPNSYSETHGSIHAMNGSNNSSTTNEGHLHCNGDASYSNFTMMANGFTSSNSAENG
eukprot:c49033_g1_i1 orf=377-694(+)